MWKEAMGITVLSLPPLLSHPRVSPIRKMGLVGYSLAHILCCVCIFCFCFCCCFLSLFNSILYEDKTVSFLAGTFSATHPSTPVIVTNDTGAPAQGSLLLMRKGRAEQARSEHKWWCPDAVSHLPPESLMHSQHHHSAPLPFCLSQRQIPLSPHSYS